jgi:c-di-AMP phosphodiesterase-like protein
MNKALKAHELCNDSLLYDALDHTDNGMIIISNKWEVLFWNQWMEYYSEIPRANALGQRFDDIFSSLLTKRLRNSIEQSLKLGRSSLLSEKLNKSPLPLFRIRADKFVGKRMN